MERGTPRDIRPDPRFLHAPIILRKSSFMAGIRPDTSLCDQAVPGRPRPESIVMASSLLKNHEHNLDRSGGHSWGGFPIKHCCSR